VVGDLNFPYIDWDSLSARRVDRAEFVRTIQEGFLKQDADIPTREGAVLDLVFQCNEPCQLVDVSVGEQVGTVTTIQKAFRY